MWSYLIALLAGGLLAFAFAPINLFTFAIFMPAVLLYLWLRTTPGRAFWTGLCFGIGFFGVGSSWVYISIHNFGNAGPALAGVLTALLILILSLYPAIQGYLIRRFWRHANYALVCLCIFPAMWVLFEYLRGTLFAGFPFLFLGYSQVNSPLSGFAPLLGVYGLSLILAVMSGALVLLTRQKKPFLPIILLLIFIIVGWSFRDHPWTHVASKPIQMSLIQGNISQQMKWDPNELRHIITTYETLTKAHAKSRIIVWPEGAIPFFPSQIPGFLNQMNMQALAQGNTLIMGALLQSKTNTAYYNGLLLLGKDHGSYLKRHLVPFGEYTPLKFIFGPLAKRFNIPMSDLSAGPAQQPPLVIAGIPVAAFICYETAFPLEALHDMQGKQLGINIVDDAWFGHSFAAAQQLQMTQMRALETGRYIAVTANTGITTLINPFGKLTALLPIDQQGVLTAKVTAMTGKTPLMHWDYYPVMLFVILMLGAGVFSLLLHRNNPP